MRARLKHVHSQVRGKTSPGMRGSQNYSAFEPDLLLWVLATLIDASVKGYEFIWGTLPGDRRENFYRDFRHFGTYFGLPADQPPAGYREFTTYYNDMLNSDLLGSHPLCAKVAATVVHPPNPLRDRLLGKLGDFLPVETVPPHIRDRLALTSTPWTRFRMAALRHTAPAAFRLLPKRLTYYPESYRAEKTLGLL